jgi:hypothetical protein
MKPAWLWNREPLPYVKPYDGYVAHPWLEYQKLAVHDVFEPVAASDRYTADFRKLFGERYAKGSKMLGWHGCVEIPSAGINEISTLAEMPEIKALWKSYLAGELGFNLREAGINHKGDPDFYKSWDDVRLPDPKDFLGWSKERCVDLRGEWEALPDPEKQGVEKRWFSPEGAPASGWVKTDCNDPMLLIYSANRGNGPSPDKDAQAFLWLKKSVKLDAKALADAKYLHISTAGWHGSGHVDFQVYVNGQAFKNSSKGTGAFDECFDIGPALKEGENQIVINTLGRCVPGYIFLGPVGARPYPAMGKAENRLWYDMVNFSAWLRLRSIETSLRAMRAADPDRPLKLMALHGLVDMGISLYDKYGAYQHDTGGAGAYWCPMQEARLVKSHRQPFSCEQGGPPKDAAELQRAMTYYLMYGTDAVDLVFAVSHYRETPGMEQWVDSNLALMRCIGKLKFVDPKLAVLRSARSLRMGYNEPWAWDVGRGSVQTVGRPVTYIELGDFANGIASKYPVVFDDATLLMDENDVESIERYVRAGGTFIAQHHTGMNSPEAAQSWPISKLTGLKVVKSGGSGKLKFSQSQTLLPTLAGKTVGGWGCVLDYLDRDFGKEGVAMEPEAKDVEVIAEWDGVPAGQGRIAVARRKLGKGQVIALGSTFWRDSRDAAGKYQDSPAGASVMDELLGGVGVGRESWTGVPDIWAERWKSKNGVFDLFQVARMSSKGEEKASAAASVVSDAKPAFVIEATANGLPKVEASWSDGKLTLPKAEFGLMQTRIYAAPRKDLERGALDWFEGQADVWRELPSIPVNLKPETIALPEDTLPLIDGWAALQGEPPANWIAKDFKPGSEWKSVRLGSFATMGFPENAKVQFVKRVKIPAAWSERDVTLYFNAEHWFWGLLPQGRLWINGEPAPLPQPVKPGAASGFQVDLKLKPGDELALAVEIDAVNATDKERRGRPSGAMGAFCLQAFPKALKSVPFEGPWQAASAFGSFKPVDAGAKAKYVYLERSFALPREWPGKRVFLESPSHLGWLVLNGKVIATPGWMRKLDVSGLVNRDGVNVLRWVPNTVQTPNAQRVFNETVPSLSLSWSN